VSSGWGGVGSAAELASPRPCPRVRLPQPPKAPTSRAWFSRTDPAARPGAAKPGPDAHPPLVHGSIAWVRGPVVMTKPGPTPHPSQVTGAVKALKATGDAGQDAEALTVIQV
jgi:hypothetical protein